MFSGPGPEGRSGRRANEPGQAIRRKTIHFTFARSPADLAEALANTADEPGSPTPMASKSNAATATLSMGQADPRLDGAACRVVTFRGSSQGYAGDLVNCGHSFGNLQQSVITQ